MLVLTRKCGQTIFIDENITIKVLSVVNGQVRIGIDAPQEVQIQRDDVKKRPELIKAVV
ncbi:Carbon storage regulator (plasmid) [Piscirickettsia salmonis]|uniref:carbon storage regulator n=1 Tax=Piscirickettsia salmonis TaxID=1238 RepID=UPI0012B6CA96|nr:carbon storage regulator [Piscirickettsia salmonis]QGP52324.1 Carbon storage regulator [Piscirickettsia salmonis]QGP57407.1 Carbon storage regulator [Piscirickettsia salmonis]QGP67002.1 Carbon storage regulator [Piscirickettsia salmonis]